MEPLPRVPPRRGEFDSAILILPARLAHPLHPEPAVRRSRHLEMVAQPRRSPGHTLQGHLDRQDSTVTLDGHKHDLPRVTVDPNCYLA